MPDMATRRALELPEGKSGQQLLRAGEIDRSKFTESGNFYFTSAVLATTFGGTIPSVAQ
jgi:hypothetical protein